MPKQNARKMKRLMERKFKKGIISEDEMNDFNHHLSINQKITQYNKQKKYNEQQIEQTKKDIEKDIQKMKSIRVDIPKSSMIIHYILSMIGQYLLLLLNIFIMIFMNSYILAMILYFVMYGILFYKHILVKSYYDDDITNQNDIKLDNDKNETLSSKEETDKMDFLEKIDNKINPYCLTIYNCAMMVINYNYLTLIMYLIGTIRRKVIGIGDNDQTYFLIGMIYHLSLLFNMNGYIIFGIITSIYMKDYKIA